MNFVNNFIFIKLVMSTEGESDSDSESASLRSNDDTDGSADESAEEKHYFAAADETVFCLVCGEGPCCAETYEEELRLSMEYCTTLDSLEMDLTNKEKRF